MQPELFSLADPNFLVLLAVLLIEVIVPLAYAFFGFRKLRSDR